MSMPRIFNVQNKKRYRQASPGFTYTFVLKVSLFSGCPRREDEIAVNRFAVRVASLAELDLNLLDTIDVVPRQKECIQDETRHWTF